MAQVPEPAGENPVALVAGALRVADGAGSVVTIRGEFQAVAFELIAYNVGAGSTLDVWVQQVLDGVNYDDIAHFVQVTGAGADDVQLATFWARRASTAAGELHSHRDGTLAAGAVVDTVLGRRFRVKWAIGGAGPGIAFQVLAHLR